MHESHSHQFHLKSPFPPGSFELLCAARKIAKNTRDLSTVFVGPLVSAFVDDKFRHDPSEEIKAAWYHGVAPLVICRGKELSDACFAVLHPEMRGGSSIRELLDRSKFPYVSVSSAEELEQNAARIREALGSEQRQGKKPTFTQERFAQPLRNHFGDEIDDAEFSSLLEEVALSSVIELPDWSRTGYRKMWGRGRPKTLRLDDKMQLEWIVNHANKTSFDFLCTREAPHLFPSLAIEFDGPSHQTQSGKIKDRLKDLACSETGLPLLRVGVNCGQPWPADPEYLEKAFRRRFADFASVFVWFTASAWEQTLKSADSSLADSSDLETARVKALHRKFPRIQNAHRELMAHLSLEERYHELIGRRPEITVESDDRNGIRAFMKLDRQTLESPWLLRQGGVPRPFVDWDELVEIYCRRHVTEQALQKHKV